MKDNAYSALAPHYERLINSCDYEQWSQYLFNRLEKYSKGKTGCDLACGSGYFTRALKKRGYDVYGVDKSIEMLNEARALCQSEGIFVEFQQQDLKGFKTFKKLDFITVINDGINYVEQKSLKSVIKSVRTALKKDGVLIFDFSSEYKLKQILGNNLYGEDTDEVTYLWFNTDMGDRIKMELTFFTREGDKYSRRDETHEQYVHTEQAVKALLEENGFEVVEITGHLGKQLEKESERINFIAIKK